MRQHHRNPPSLKAVAQQVHLSEYHFQRLFTAWAGISPKRFAQYLTVEYAKAKIADTKSLLALSTEAGLSGPGRLHDLFVTLEAMSPGEFKAGGASLTIRYGIHSTPFGPCLLAITSRGVCNLQFVEDTAIAEAENALKADWPNATLIPDQPATQDISDRIFSAPGSSPPAAPLALHVKGTNFQVQVWRALLQLPFAGMTTYQDLSQSIGRPTAARAVGTAVGRNPVGIIIPCHRVIRASGELGGYRWGLDRKAAVLGWEASQQASKESSTPEQP
ncbi:MAG: methylated-DNA--[protein]-cysteine S-methyltransferase [Cyanobacteria bacterium P01_A01_bin.135]